jgi:hypothetical protein
MEAVHADHRGAGLRGMVRDGASDSTESDHDDVGDIFRAVRLLIDTGIH